jgi:hypothetical protein
MGGPGEVAQSVSSEFKPQHQKTKKRNIMTFKKENSCFSEPYSVGGSARFSGRFIARPDPCIGQLGLSNKRPQTGWTNNRNPRG